MLLYCIFEIEFILLSLMFKEVGVFGGLYEVIFIEDILLVDKMVFFIFFDVLMLFLEFR